MAHRWSRASGVRSLSTTSCHHRSHRRQSTQHGYSHSLPHNPHSHTTHERPPIVSEPAVRLFKHEEPIVLERGETLARFDLAYETWGELNEDSSNVVLLHTGLSASSHARSHEQNSQLGWWEEFIGPGNYVDTSKFFVVCVNALGGCFGSTGPAAIDPATGDHYGTNFPVVTIGDIVRTQFLLLDSLGVGRVHACVGSSMGGMQSLLAAAKYGDRVGRMVTISASARSYPQSIAFRYIQRRALMTDPNWNGGHYYGKAFPHVGMKNAREIGIMTYRSGPEWDKRFGRMRVNVDSPPTLEPDFAIESYLDRQSQKFTYAFDPNSLLYLSKAMDMFDVSAGFGSLQEGLGQIHCPTLVIGVQSDILFPVWQQREIASMLRLAGLPATYFEIVSDYGHDTFLVDTQIGAAVKGHLETMK